MSLRTCAAAKCTNRFEPYLVDQLYCSANCSARMRMRLFRARKRYGGDPGGGGKQRALFSKSLLAKARPPKPAPVVLPSLFESDMLASIGGAVEYRGDGSWSDKNRYSVKLAGPKSPARLQPFRPSQPSGEKHAA